MCSASFRFLQGFESATDATSRDDSGVVTTTIGADSAGLEVNPPRPQNGVRTIEIHHSGIGALIVAILT
jgi:hypothetical protein